MKYKISVSPDRVKYIIAELGEAKAEIIRTYQNEILGKMSDFTEISITIETNGDALNLFHAGIKYAMKSN